MRTAPLRRAAVTAVAALVAATGSVALAAPADATHVAAVAVSQAGNDGAYVTLQVDVTFTASNTGGGTFSWGTGDGRTGNVSDGVTSGAYAGDATGSGYLSGGSGVLGTYSWTRTQPTANVARTRLTYAYAYAGAYTVDWSDCCPEVNGALPVSVQSSLPACGNSVDDDGDGVTDYPNDPGCADANDRTETPECPSLVPTVDFCLAAVGDATQEVTIRNYDLTTTPGPSVVGYLDTYRFTVAGVGVSLPCVTLAVEGGETNACARAGGVRIDRRTLVSAQVPVPSVTPGEVLVSYGLCRAELVATALGFGVSSAPAYTLCEANEVSL